MVEGKPVISRGLEGIYIGESAICKVDGTAGKLYYRGYPIEEIAEHSSFEEASYLVLYGRLPTAAELSAYDAALKESRALPKHVIDIIKNMSGKADTMDILRTALSAMSAEDKEVDDSSEAANLRKSARIISATASIVATIGRIMEKKRYVKPNAWLSHAGNLLYMLKGRKPTKEEAKLLDVMMVLHVEHSTNASTFSTMVTGATLSDIYSAIVAGIATLKGPLHGGADRASLRMMYTIGKPENTESYINDALAGKQRIMGFGHRVYKTYDPRAKVMHKYLEQLSSTGTDEVKNLIAIAFSAEKMMIEKLGESKGIWPNVDFFSGPIYVQIGVPIDLFTPVFAASRAPGWCAHMMEYWKDNRLMRPLEYYDGPIGLEYVPIESRK